MKALSRRSGKRIEHNLQPPQITRIKDKIRTTYITIWQERLYRQAFYILLAAIITTVFMNVFEYSLFKTNMYDSNFDKTLWQRMVSGFYYAFVTMSTVGYGDMAPDSILGKFYAIGLIMFGVISVSFLTASIASTLVERRLREGRGLGDISSIKDHFIICGWKRNMAQVLHDILAQNPEFHPRDVIIIANVDPENADLIRQQNPHLNDIRFLRGDYYNETMLKKARVDEAKLVFILADESVTASISEIDSQTVMAAMTITALAKEVRICAELLDLKYERYLLNTHVDEIVYTNEYGRLLFANSGASTGMAKVINDLLDVNTEVFIRTVPFPDEFIGKQYYELRVYFNEQADANLIGLIENVGSFYRHKQEAIKEAQKTPDISKLVSNLQQVKTMVSNRPNLHPGDDYVIPKNCLGVIIERTLIQE